MTPPQNSDWTSSEALVDSLKMSSNPIRWDIFCRVVDHYGDIGVCWRLARQLATEFPFEVRLWVDRLETFARMCPTVSADLKSQRVGPIEVCLWPNEFPEVEPADVVIEAFACEIPSSYVNSMARREFKPAWINLEYLSAEDWIEDCHQLVSPRAGLPLQKHFFFPGFSPNTGGLLREHNLLESRDKFDSSASAQFWERIQVP